MFNPPDEVHTGLDLIRGYWRSYGKSKFNEPEIREEDSKIVSFFLSLFPSRLTASAIYFHRLFDANMQNAIKSIISTIY
jgi:hypothetical protein